MIDEKKLIEILTKWEYDALPIERDLIEAIIYLVEDQPKVGEWIPCSERMPEKEAKEYIKEQLNGVGYLYPCLLTYKSPNTEKIHVVRFYYDVFQNWFVNSGEILCEKDRCLAWQPLPEPAKETTWAE